jgi:Aminotransferase class-V
MTRLGNDLARFWQLDPEVIYLNHGSLGACPTPVLEAQHKLRAAMEAGPIGFFDRDLEPALDAARAALGAFIGAAPADLVFVPNATAAVNTVLRSLRFSDEDELLVTDHAYRACANALEFVAERSGASIAVADVPLPPRPGSGPTDYRRFDPLQEALRFDHGIEVPIMPWPAPPARLIRVCAQAYNSPAQYEALAAALTDSLKNGK